MKVTLNGAKRSPETAGRLAARLSGRMVRIWSGQWKAWWRRSGDNACGYTENIEEAGVFSFEDAWSRTFHCGPEKKIEYHLAPEFGGLHVRRMRAWEDARARLTKANEALEATLKHELQRALDDSGLQGAVDLLRGLPESTPATLQYALLYHEHGDLPCSRPGYLVPPELAALAADQHDAAEAAYAAEEKMVQPLVAHANELLGRHGWEAARHFLAQLPSCAQRDFALATLEIGRRQAPALPGKAKSGT